MSKSPRAAENVHIRTQPANSKDYYRPRGYVGHSVHSAMTDSLTQADSNQILSAAEEKLRLLQEEERRNRTRAQLLDDEFKTKQLKVKSLTTQQDERRAHLRALDEEIVKKQHAINKMEMDAEERSQKLQPLEEQFQAKKQAVDNMTKQQQEIRGLLRKLEEEMSVKQRAIAALGDQSAEAADKQKVIGDLLIQQRRLQDELDRHRKQVQDKEAHCAAAETHNEVLSTNGDRLQLQLKMLEQEHQMKRQTLEALRSVTEEEERQLNDLQKKSVLVERETARRRTEMQLVEEELALKKQMLQEVMVQEARLREEASHEQRRLRSLRSAEDMERENAGLREQLVTAKQELQMTQLSLEDKTYKLQSMETVMQVQRSRQEAAPLGAGSALSTAPGTGAEQRQQLMAMLRRQEDRITRQLGELGDKDARLKKLEMQALQEQELREMVENELSVALAELQMEKGKVAMLQRTCDTQDMKVTALENELERVRQQDLLLLMNERDEEEVDDIDTSDPPLPENDESLRRQKELLRGLEKNQIAESFATSLGDVDRPHLEGPEEDR